MQLNKSSFNIIPLFLVILIDSVGWGVAFPVFEPLLVGNVTGILSSTTGIGLRNFYYEMVIAVYCICMFLGSPVLGSLSDRYGRKIILQVSMLGAALGLFCCALGSLWSSIVLILVLSRVRSNVRPKFTHCSSCYGGYEHTGGVALSVGLSLYC